MDRAGHRETDVDRHRKLGNGLPERCAGGGPPAIDERLLTGSPLAIPYESNLAPELADSAIRGTRSWMALPVDTYLPNGGIGVSFRQGRPLRRSSRFPGVTGAPGGLASVVTARRAATGAGLLVRLG